MKTFDPKATAIILKVEAGIQEQKKVVDTALVALLKSVAEDIENLVPPKQLQ